MHHAMPRQLNKQIFNSHVIDKQIQQLKLLFA